ncbi:aldose 1-epimerase family protein [Williamsia sp. CHRR-6]|uniref:aldose 1-epimerase family protein n=1 Tax=Williamsia sp. CHRR-6 TaxID=2835871 RepID=UPI001BDB61DB|nr:aldose 1-epimerase family protein [Williamsia sp. CHRR-6]MBT0566434.1 aldose 1-epimerase family protein [Williamsia sp. CHRR-6]
MAEYRITAGDYSAILVGRGAALRELRFGDRLLTETWEVPEGTKPPMSAGLVLAPWPNRVADGRFTFAGVEHHLELTEPARGNAIHGFVRTVDFAVVDVATDAVAFTVDVGRHPGWPFDLTLGVHYQLAADTGLTVTLTASNVGDGAAPFALGHHAFVRCGDAPIDDCLVHLPAASMQPVDAQRQLPQGDPVSVAGTEFDFRTPRALAGTWLDTPLTDLTATDGRFRHRVSAPDGATTELWTDLNFGWVQVFTADPAKGQEFPGRGRALAIEPMTAPPDALATGHDLITMEPGQSWTGTWGLVQFERFGPETPA